MAGVNVQGSIHDNDAAAVAALERGVSGMRDAFGAERVYGALIGEDGLVEFKASSPVGTGVPVAWKRDEVAGLAEAIETGVVTRLGEAPEPLDACEMVVVVPLSSRGRTFGLLVAVWAARSEVPESQVLALVGSQLGLALDALCDCGTLAHRLAEHLEASELLDRVLELVPSAVKVIDLDGRVLCWNPGCERLYGWSAEDVLGERMPHVPEDMRLRAVQDIRRIAAGGTLARRESVGVREDGSHFALALEIVPFVERDGHPAGVVSLAFEATGKEAAFAGGDDLLAAVAQSLTGPLTAILGFAQLLARPEILEDEGRRARTLKALEERGGRMSALVDDLLLATGLGERGLVLELESTDLASVVTEAVSRFEQGRHRNRFVIDYDASMAPVTLDRRRIEQAIVNLLDNAVRFSPPDAEICLAVRLEEGEAVVEVADGGPGIDPEERERLFDRFYRGSDDGSGEVPGSGLGLYIVRMIAEAHGGSASVSGETGRESTFAIRIPARNVPDR